MISSSSGKGDTGGVVTSGRIVPFRVDTRVPWPPAAFVPTVKARPRCLLIVAKATKSCPGTNRHGLGEVISNTAR